MIEAQSAALTALNTNGQTIIDFMVFSLAGEFSSLLSRMIADCLWAFLESSRNETLQWIRSSLERAPNHSPSGLAIRADAKQKFYSDTEKCEDIEPFKSICSSLADEYNA